MSKQIAETARGWWPCICGDHHQGKPRHVGAITGEGLVMHAPRSLPVLLDQRTPVDTDGA